MENLCGAGWQTSRGELASGQLCFSSLFLQARRSTHVHKSFSFWIPKGSLHHSWERPSQDTSHACPCRSLPFHVQPSDRRRTGDGPGRSGSFRESGFPRSQKSSPAPKGKSCPHICCLPCKALKRSGAAQGGSGDATCLPGLRKERTGLLAGTHAPWVALSKSSSTQAVSPSVKWEE